MFGRILQFKSKQRHKCIFDNNQFYYLQDTGVYAVYQSLILDEHPNITGIFDKTHQLRIDNTSVNSLIIPANFME